MRKRKWLMVLLTIVIVAGILSVQRYFGLRQAIAERSSFTILQQAAAKQQQTPNFLYWVSTSHLTNPEKGESLKQQSMTTGKVSFQDTTLKGFAEDTKVHSWVGSGANPVRLSDYDYYLFYQPELGFYSGGSENGAAPIWERIDKAGESPTELPDYQHILYLRKPLGDLNWIERVEQIGKKTVNDEKWLQLEIVLKPQFKKQAYAYLVNESLKPSEITSIDDFTIIAYLDEQNNLRQIDIDSSINYLIREANYPEEKGTISNNIKLNIEQVSDGITFTPPAGIHSAF